MEYDFGGYATKSNIRCSDGKTIAPNAFADSLNKKVPLVWQHNRESPDNVLGHAHLVDREGDVYAYCKFNNNQSGETAKELVRHGDISSLSIWANNLVYQNPGRKNVVIHGAIREVSLVLSGANPGALIDDLSMLHGEYDDNADEAIIYTDVPIELDAVHEETEKEDDVTKEEDTLADVYDTFTDEQKQLVAYMLGAVLIDEEEVEHSDPNEESSDEDADDQNEKQNEDEGLEHSNKNERTNNMSRNVFQTSASEEVQQSKNLTRDQITAIFDDAKKLGSLKDSVLVHAEEYGIQNIDYLFPDFQKLSQTPDFISRRMEWVNSVMTGVHRTPFSRVKSVHADITADEARARGYITGDQKISEVFPLLKRTTDPQTIYKFQQLDRDDITDITDMNVVAWLKVEMRKMLDEEIARAVLIGDGREADDRNHIQETHVRSILNDHGLYSRGWEIDADATMDEVVESMIKSRKRYRGSGKPTLFTTTDFATELLLSKDKMGRRYYRSFAEVASDLGVKDIVEVEVMEFAPKIDGPENELDFLAISVNLDDYNIGADKGGEVSMFDDFDIRFNQYQYLIETRISGALTIPSSAIVYGRTTETEATTPDNPLYWN